MTQTAFTRLVNKVTVHAKRDIRHAVFVLRHNGALITFILILGAGMWFAGSYMQRHPIMTATMDARAGCDVGNQLHQTVRAICAPSR